MVEGQIPQTEDKKPTRVFISYSWDSEEHKNRVLSLANTLRSPWGIETDLDQYVRAKSPFTPVQGWDLWMEKRIEWAEFVLIVCTATYKRRFRGDEEPSQGRGVTWEGTIIRQKLYNDQLNNTKFIPIVFSGQDLNYVPLILNAHDKYILDNEESFRTLGYRLRKEPMVIIPEVAVGKLPSPPQPTFFPHSKTVIEPPPVSLDITQIESLNVLPQGTGEVGECIEEKADRNPPLVPLKELQECDSAKLLFIKNVKAPDGWAYSLEQMEQRERRVFGLVWRPGSHGISSPQPGDLMILHQRAKVTHIVEFLDDEVLEQPLGSFRWVRVVWIAEGDWNQLPHQKDILGFSPSYADGRTHSFKSADFSTFRAAWNSVEEFQQHIFNLLTQPELTISEEDILTSEKGVDYTRLRDLLKEWKWKEADQETAQRMCEVMGRQKEGWLRIEDIEQFPHTDLRTIDRLWVKYSSGKFGFSVQKGIWQKNGSPSEYNGQWEKFGEFMGWKIKGWMERSRELSKYEGVLSPQDCDRVLWKDYDQLSFDLNAPKGHLPIAVFYLQPKRVLSDFLHGFRNQFCCFIQYFLSCDI